MKQVKLRTVVQLYIQVFLADRLAPHHLLKAVPGTAVIVTTHNRPGPGVVGPLSGTLKFN